MQGVNVPTDNFKRIKTITTQDQIARRQVVQNTNPNEIRPSGILSHPVASFQKPAPLPPSSVTKLNGVISVTETEAKIINSGGYVNYSHPPPVITKVIQIVQLHLTFFLETRSTKHRIRTIRTST